MMEKIKVLCDSGWARDTLAEVVMKSDTWPTKTAKWSSGKEERANLKAEMGQSFTWSRGRKAALDGTYHIFFIPLSINGPFRGTG